jgi:hypothetical protein
MTVHLVTYYTTTHKANYLVDSAHLHGITIQNLATTTKWNGLQDKLLAIRQFVKTLDSNDIVCFVDAYDVIVNSDLETIEKVFKVAKCDILFGAEQQLDPPVFSIDSYPQSPTPFRFLNSGVYIGYVHAIQRMVNTDSFLHMNDQEYCNRYFLDNRQSENISLDTGTQLALNMFKVSWNMLSISEGNITFEFNNTIPCFIHFNGLSYLYFSKDFQRTDDGFRHVENSTSTRLLDTLVKAKQLTKENAINCYLTGKGHTY